MANNPESVNSQAASPTLLSISVLLIAMGSAGWLVGWLTGASQSPVVSGVVAGIIGILTTIMFSGLLLQQRSPSRENQKESPSEGMSSSSNPRVPERMIVAVGLGVLTLCLACFIGVNAGVAKRVPSYSSATQYFTSGTLKESTLTPLDKALILRTRWRMRALSIPAEDADAAMRMVVIPAVTDKSYIQLWESGGETRPLVAQHRALHAAVEHLLAGLEPQPIAVPTSHIESSFGSYRFTEPPPVPAKPESDSSVTPR